MVSEWTKYSYLFIGPSVIMDIRSEVTNHNPRLDTNSMFDLDFTGDLVLIYLYQKVNVHIISQL